MWSPFWISILAVLRAWFLCHSLHFKPFCIIQVYFSQALKISTNWRGTSNFLGKPILQNGWIILSLLLYFNFKSVKYPNSWSFIRSQCIMYDSGVLFSEFWNFHKLRRVGSFILGETILQKGWIICSPLLYFNFKSLKDPNCLSFTRFWCILHDSWVPFSDFLNFHKLKRANIISCGEPILQNGWLIWCRPLYFNFKSFEGANSLSFTRCQSILHN